MEYWTVSPTSGGGTGGAVKNGARLVIAVSRERIALAFAVGGAVIVEEQTERGDSLEHSAKELVARIASTNSGRTLVDLLVWRPLASRKELFGLQAGLRVDEVRTRLREAPHGYFLGDEGTIVTGEPALSQGAWWATAVDRSTLEALLSACGTLSIERCRVIAMHGPADEMALGTAAREAAAEAVHDRLALDPLVGARRERGARRRFTLLALTLTLGLTAAAVGPALTHALLARRESLVLAALQVTVNDTHRWARTLAAQQRDDATQLIDLARRAPLRTPLISSLGGALPDSAVVMSLAVDSTVGTVVVLGPPGVDVLGAISQVASIAEARLDGAVMRERFLERDVNRTTVTFRIQPSDGAR